MKKWTCDTVLKELRAITGRRYYIFHSSRGKTGRISNGAMLGALRRMGYAGRMTGHGFRTVASTILNEKRYDRDVIEAQLAHGDEDEFGVCTTMWNIVRNASR